MQAQRIAIVGSGISGLTAAYLLGREHDITVFEANDYIGGHTHTVTVTPGEKPYAIDTGFIVCNDRNYHNFLKFMEQLGVTLQPTEMSFSVRNDLENLEYNGHNLNTLFAQRRNLLRPRFIRLVRDILRFNEAARAAIDSGEAEDATLEEFIGRHGLSQSLANNYLLPMVAAIWSCSINQAGAFPLQFFLRFFMNHGLLDIRNRPQWYVLQGGSHAYIKPMTRSFSDRILLNSPVESVSRYPTHVEIKVRGKIETFDQVVLACHSDQALAMLTDASEKENEILGAMAYQDNDVILHSDTSLLPQRRLAWASWNFLAGSSADDQPPLVSYCMNILQGIDSKENFLVSLNARDKIDPAKILGEYRYAHPVYSTESIAAQAQRDTICGVNRTHFCGAYWYNGFHEDGVKSALDVAGRFGESL